jgi:hypothetical protein
VPLSHCRAADRRGEAKAVATARRFFSLSPQAGRGKVARLSLYLAPMRMAPRVDRQSVDQLHQDMLIKTCAILFILQVVHPQTG